MSPANGRYLVYYYEYHFLYITALSCGIEIHPERRLLKLTFIRHDIASDGANGRYVIAARFMPPERSRRSSCG